MKKKPETTSELLWIYGRAILLAVGVALLIRTFVAEAYRIPTASMQPTLQPGDTIFVLKAPFGLRLPFFGDRPALAGRSPHRGEVVVFISAEKQGIFSIRRVLGLPGDEVAIRQGQVTVNGTALMASPEGHGKVAKMERIPDRCGQERVSEVEYGVCWGSPSIPDFGPQKVPEGMAFVLGDNRVQFEKAPRGKAWPLVPLSSIQASAWRVLLSIDYEGGQGLGKGAGPLGHVRWNRFFRTIQ